MTIRKSRRHAWIALGGSSLILLSSVLAGCSTKTVSASQKTGQNNPNAIYRELGGWPAPPTFQGNPYASGGVGSAWTFVYDGLFQFVRSSEKIYNVLAQSYNNSNPSQTVVHLRHDVKWSDGQPFTSKDVWAYYTLNNGASVTKYLSGISTPDPYTVVFHWASPAPINLMKIQFLATDKQEIPYHIYKSWVDKAASLLAQAQPGGDPAHPGPFGLNITKDLQQQLNNNWQDFQKHGPKTPVGTGPYVVQKVTQNEMQLTQNPYYYNKANVHFKMIQLQSVNDLSQQYALLKAGKIDRYDGTQPKDILESLLAANKDLVHYRMVNYSCTGFLFNESHKPFDNVVFRQAVIDAVDRDKVRQVANWYGHDTQLSTTGIPTGLVSQWVDPSLMSQFTKFPYDPNKAAQLLQSIGWSKGSDGNWHDPTGKVPHFTIAGDAGTVEWVNAGEAVAEQLTSFGLPTTFQSVDSSIYYQNAQAAKDSPYDMTFDKVDVSWSFNDPWYSLTNTYWGSPAQMAHLPLNSQAKADLVATGFDGQKVDVETLLNQLPYMQDPAQRKHAIDEMAYVTNQDAWGVNIYQLTTGTWFNSKDIGNLPWPDGIKKYNRNVPEVDPSSPYFERILETNEGFSADRWLVDGTYAPN